MKTASSARIFLHRHALLLVSLFITLWAVWQARILEDAYITFRVVDNAVHGYGLRWNVDERVQTYTNPLWMLLHIPFYAVWDNIFVITIILSVLCTLGTLWLSMRTWERSPLQAATLFLAPLFASRSFMKYSVCGLENPLSHLLFAAFGYALLRAPDKNRAFWLSVIASLAMVNRLDEALLYLPVGLYLLWKERPLRLCQYVSGSLPIICWLAFSLIYYGFLFPNTRYSKLITGVSEWEYMVQGYYYFVNLWAMDITSAAILCGVIASLPALYIFPALRSHISPPMRAIAAGILLYSFYVILVGGDYLSGRFWSLPVFASIWWLYGVASPFITKRQAVITASVLGAIWLVYPSYDTIDKYCPACNFRIMPGTLITIPVKGYLVGKTHLPKVEAPGEPSYFVGSVMIGMKGYSSGPMHHIADFSGISDPLLARLPSLFKKFAHFAGHFRRDSPPGYAKAMETGVLDEMDPDLAVYYAKLRFITRGDIWDKNRLEEIIRFNLGEYNGFRDAYIARNGMNPL